MRSNALTGSTVVAYDPKIITSIALLDILKSNGYAIDLENSAVNRKLRQAHEELAMKVSKAAVTWLAGRVLEANGLSMVARLI
jgi:hypothetical protein